MRRLTLVAIAGLSLCACQNGTVTLSVADAPIDGATSAVIAFTGVDLVETDGSTHSFDFNPPVAPNLLSTASTQLLTNATLPAGDYQKITLHIAAAPTIETDAESFLIYPATSTISRTGKQPLQLVTTDTDAVDVPATFHVTRLRNTAITADFDLRKSILNPDVTSDPLVLDPSVRVVTDVDVGTLTGTVAGNLVASGARCDPGAIYVYQGAGVTPGDEGGSTSQPFTSTTLASGGSSTSGFVSYTVGFLPAGTYTVALICNPEVDDPAADDHAALDVAAQQNVSIVAGITTTANAFQ